MFPVINKKETGVNLRRIMDQRGVAVKDVQQYLGLGSVQSVYRWLSGISMPTIDNLYALSELFQLPIDAMVCGNRPSKTAIVQDVSYETVDTQRQRLFEYCTKLQEKLAA